MSAYGTKPTSKSVPYKSAIGVKRTSPLMVAMSADGAEPTWATGGYHPSRPALRAKRPRDCERTREWGWAQLGALTAKTEMKIRRNAQSCGTGNDRPEYRVACPKLSAYRWPDPQLRHGDRDVLAKETADSRNCRRHRRSRGATRGLGEWPRECGRTPGGYASTTTVAG